MLLHKIFLGVGIHTEYAVLGNFRSREQLLSGKWDSISIHTPKGVRTVKKWRDEALGDGGRRIEPLKAH